MIKKLIAAITFLIIAGFFAVAGYAGWRVYQLYKPSTEMTDLAEFYGVHGDQVAIMLDNTLQETQGRYADGACYLPSSWVYDNLNERFYWDEEEQKIIYALPNSVDMIDLSQTGKGQAPLFRIDGGQLEISIELIGQYTNIRSEQFLQEDVKRVYIDTLWEDEEYATTKKKCVVRFGQSIKNSIITKLPQNSRVQILEEEQFYYKVRTDNGNVGYLMKRKLTEPTPVKPVSSFDEPVYTNINLDEKVVLVWHLVTSVDSGNGLINLLDRSKAAPVNVVCPTWFSLTDNEGNFTSLASQEYVNRAHERGIQVWAMLDNFNENVYTATLMGTYSRRAVLIERLMNELNAYGIDGINLDIESIPEEAAPHFVQFVRELSIACRSNGKVLSIDNHVPAPHNYYYNRKEQGIVADYVIIMGYDEHYSGGEMGSVASLPFVRKGIEDTLAEVDASKVINAVPFYTRAWIEDKDGNVSSEALTMGAASKWFRTYGVKKRWSTELGQYYGEIKLRNGGKQCIWLEDIKSLQQKMNVIREFDLAGVAGWQLSQLGSGDAKVWEVLNWDVE